MCKSAGMGMAAKTWTAKPNAASIREQSKRCIVIEMSRIPQPKKDSVKTKVPVDEKSAQSALIHAHVEQLRACRACTAMPKPVVSGRPVVSKVVLFGQAPGDKEPVMGKPF